MKLDKIYDVQFNDQTASSLGLLLYDYPSFSGARKNYDTYAVAGRLGELVGLDQYKTNLEISCTFSVFHEMFVPKIREIKEWLSGTGKLRLTDTPDSFYKVWKINYGTMERELRSYGRFTITFICTPYEFLDSGQIEADKVPYNAYCLSRPIYKIQGSGSCVLAVNGKEMTATVNQNLTIDTERMLAYRDDGTIHNTDVEGNYEDLYLLPGSNEISITSRFGLSIVPNWGYDV